LKGKFCEVGETRAAARLRRRVRRAFFSPPRLMADAGRGAPIL
jgi:hypothetical protein